MNERIARMRTHDYMDGYGQRSSEVYGPARRDATGRGCGVRLGGPSEHGKDGKDGVHGQDEYGSRVDLRSKSRDGEGDLGVNAPPIRLFRSNLLGG
jgi:hypothetical protein